MKKVLHLVPIDKKFIKIIIRLFEDNKSLDNTYIVENNNYNIDLINKDNIFYKKSTDLIENNFINSIKKYDIIIVHYLTIGKAKLLNKINFNIKIIWAAWGGDFYINQPILKNKLLGNKTAKLETQINSTIKNSILKPILNKIYPQRTTYYQQKKVINKINYIAPVIYDDYKLIKKYYNASHLKFINFSYGNLEDDFLKGIDYKENIIGKNILVGNSCTFSNNHIEVFDIISHINLSDKRIITPLNYGEIFIQNSILTYGKQKLNKNFYPLINFMKKQEYHKLISTCGFVIMNHHRQQALSNIITMMYLGAKIFLNKKNPTYDYFKRLGSYVYTIDDIIEQKEKAFTPLTQDKINQNREVLIKTRSKKVVAKYIQAIAEL